MTQAHARTSLSRARNPGISPGAATEPKASPSQSNIRTKSRSCRDGRSGFLVRAQPLEGAIRSGRGLASAFTVPLREMPVSSRDVDAGHVP